MQNYKQNRNTSRQIVGTDIRIIEAVEARFGRLEVDLAAIPELAKAPEYITPEMDSLSYKTEWPINKLCWINPPFNNTGEFAKKAAGYRRAYGDRFKCLMLVPASIGTNWFINYCYPYASVIPLKGRPHFQGYEERAGVDFMLVNYSGEPGKLEQPWDWEATWARC